MIRSFKGMRPTIPATCYVDDSAQIIGDVILGEHASIWMNAVIRGDVFANHFDQELAESVVGVLRQAGVNVHVPRRQRGSGMSALVVGDLDHARELALANLRVLGDMVRDGYTVVCSEPTAALMLRREYLKLTDDLDASLVAQNTMDVGQYLAGLAARGQLPEPKHPLHARVGYHQPSIL